MSIHAVSAAFKYDCPSPTAKLVLLALANYADADGRCWPRISTIAEETGLSDRAIRNALSALEAAGALSRTVQRRQDGTRKSDLYTLTIGQAAEGAACDDKRHEVPSIKRHVVPHQAARGAALTTFEPSREPSVGSDEPTARVRRSDFDVFWEAYPAKVGKKAAAVAWSKAKDRPALPVVLAALDLYRRTKPADRAWCNPATWINQGRWDDQPEGGSPPAGEPAVATFDHPAVRASIVAAKDEDFAVRWIDTYCRWRPDRVIVARSSAVAAALNRELGPWLSRHNVRVEVEPANTNDPSHPPAHGEPA